LGPGSGAGTSFTSHWLSILGTTAAFMIPPYLSHESQQLRDDL
jgi:hypothetical protein